MVFLELICRSPAEPDYAALKEEHQGSLEPRRLLADRDAHAAGQPGADRRVRGVGRAGGARRGAGTGNFALLAAAEGASVVASDLTPKLMERGQASARPPRASTSSGSRPTPRSCRSRTTASTAPRPSSPRCSRRGPSASREELFRVTRPGNTVGMANWAPDGFSGRMFGLFNEFVPRAGGHSRAGRVGDRGRRARALRRPRRDARDASAATCRSSSTPSTRCVASMENERAAGGHEAGARAGALRRGDAAASGSSIGEFNQADDGSVRIESEYLLVVARKRG